jgi:hypothetical protein
LVNIPGIGYGLSSSGSKVVSPTVTKKYTISAYSISSLFSVKTKSLEITVVKKTDPEETGSCSISSFSASRYSLNSWESTNLSWNTNNCTSVNLSGVGIVSSSGSKSVYPSVSTTYVLTGFNQNGSQVKSDLRITVDDDDNDDCRVEISADDTRIEEGDSTRLEWDARGCRDVKISDVGYVSDSGSKKVYPDEDTTYRLTAYDSKGNYFTDSVKIYVDEEDDDDDDDDDDDCQIDSFTLSDSSVNYGDRVTLKWRTSDCDDVYISGFGYVDEDGSEQINAYFSNTYTMRASGPGRTRTKSVKLNVGSSYNVTPVVNYNAEVVTTVATNITENSAYLNGLISSSSFTANNVYFEYGETVNLGLRTPAKVATYDTNFNHYLSGLKSNTIYYFRAVAENSSGNIYRGAIQVFRTSGKIYTSGSSTSVTNKTTVVTQGKTVYGSASPLVLEIGNKYQIFNTGDEIEYFVHYKNISNSVLSYPMIQVYIPEGIEVKNISNGTYSERDRILSIPLPNLKPDDEGVVYIQAEVDSIDNQLSQIVTTAVLVYTNPNGAQENAMAYVLNTPGDNGNMLGASAFLGGFGDIGLVGWLLIILLILLIILVVRLIYHKKDKEQVIVTETKK